MSATNCNYRQNLHNSFYLLQNYLLKSKHIILEVHPETLARIFYQLDLSEVVERCGQRIARYLPVSVFHLRHGMRTDILVVREIVPPRLEEDVAVGV